MKIFIYILFLVNGALVSAQVQVDTDIFLYEIDWDKKQLKKKKNLTNWKGYDNQPFSAFSPLAGYPRHGFSPSISPRSWCPT